jgi:hypothetical protein
MYANVLSFAEVEDTYPIMYIPSHWFTPHLPHRDMVFYRRGKMYIADWYDTEETEEHDENTMPDSEDDMGAHVTAMYTKAEKLCTKRAYQYEYLHG